MDQTKPIVSHSEVATFSLCQRRHFYAFGEKIVRKKKSAALNRGIEGHTIVAKIFSELQRTADINVAEKTLYDEMTRIMKEDALLYADFMSFLPAWFEKFKRLFNSWKIEFVEHQDFLEFPEFIYAFTVDLGVWENGLLGIVDWKFVYNFYDGDMQELLPQIPRYVGALRALGHNVMKGSYGFIRYRHLKDVTIERFTIIPISLSTKRIQNSFKDLIVTAREILKLRALPLQEWKDSVARTSNELVCNNCSYKPLCAVELNGLDGLMMRKYDYEVTTYGYGRTDLPGPSRLDDADG